MRADVVRVPEDAERLFGPVPRLAVAAGDGGALVGARLGRRDQEKNAQHDAAHGESYHSLTVFDGDWSNRIAITEVPTEFNRIADVRASGAPPIRGVPSAPTPRALLDRSVPRPR